MYNHMVVDSLSLTLAAVADPTRRSILRQLTVAPAKVTDLARPFEISQQAVSKHLAYLERARLIEKKRDGRVHLCTLDARPLQEVAEWAAEYRRFWEESFERLDTFLDELKTKEPRHDRKD
jgi:DNA-binding transcriptional ArsR family regulator